MKIYLYLLLQLTLFACFAQVDSVLPELSKSFTNVRDFTIYRDEAYISAQSPLGDQSTIIQLKQKNGKWSEVKIASFSGNHHDIEPFLSTNGLKLYFASNRPNKSGESKNYDIWYVIRKGINAKWSNPTNMGMVINTKKNEFYPSVANNGNIYFTANFSDSKGKDDIYVSEFRNNTYQKPYSLGTEINSSGDEYNAYIAPNEAYIIFGAYKRQDSLGSGDLYMSQKDEHGKWSQAKNLGDKINSAAMDYCPFVEHETNTLYFTSKRKNTRAEEYKSIEEMLDSYNNYQNGMSRIYKSMIKTSLK